MSDTDNKILDALTSLTGKVDSLTKKVDNLETGQREQGQKLDTLIEKVDHLSEGQSQIRTTLKVVEGTIRETKDEVDEIKRRQHPRKVD